MPHPLKAEVLDHGSAKFAGKGSRLAALRHVLGGHLKKMETKKETQTRGQGREKGQKLSQNGLPVLHRKSSLRGTIANVDIADILSQEM